MQMVILVKVRHFVYFLLSKTVLIRVFQLLPVMCRRKVIQTFVYPVLVVILYPELGHFFHLTQLSDSNKYTFKSSHRNNPLNRSINQFYFGFPCWIWFRVSPFWVRKWTSLSDINLGPLFTRAYSGNLRSSFNRDKIRIIRSAGNEILTSIARHSRILSSIIFNILIRLPQYKL